MKASAARKSRNGHPVGSFMNTSMWLKIAKRPARGVPANMLRNGEDGLHDIVERALAFSPGSQRSIRPVIGRIVLPSLPFAAFAACMCLFERVVAFMAFTMLPDVAAVIAFMFVHYTPPCG